MRRTPAFCYGNNVSVYKYRETYKVAVSSKNDIRFMSATTKEGLTALLKSLQGEQQ